MRFVREIKRRAGAVVGCMAEKKEAGRAKHKEEISCSRKDGTLTISGRMSVQLTSGFYYKDFLQYFPLLFSEEPYDYTDNMRLISLPILFIAGGEDDIYSQGIKRYGYDHVVSGQKRYVELPGYGHTDLVMGRNVSQDVYPLMLEWMTGIEGE